MTSTSRQDRPVLHALGSWQFWVAVAAGSLWPLLRMGVDALFPAEGPTTPAPTIAAHAVAIVLAPFLGTLVGLAVLRRLLRPRTIAAAILAMHAMCLIATAWLSLHYDTATHFVGGFLFLFPIHYVLSWAATGIMLARWREPVHP